jgi:hypothetical protein
VWSKSAKLLIVRFKVKGRIGFAFPVPVWVVNEFFEALADLAWVGEIALKCVPLPREEEAQNHLRWVKAISPSGIAAALHSLVKDLSSCKGLEVADVEAGNIWVKLSFK